MLKATGSALTEGVKGTGIGAAPVARRGGCDVLARLRVALPDVPEAELARHQEWYRLRSLYAARKQAEKEVSGGVRDAGEVRHSRLPCAVLPELTFDALSEPRRFALDCPDSVYSMAVKIREVFQHSP